MTLLCQEKNVPVATFLQNYIALLLAHFATLSKGNVQWVALKACSDLSEKDVNLAAFYYVVCCTYHSSLKIKSPVSGVKRLMLIVFENNVNPTLNLTDS